MRFVLKLVGWLVVLALSLVGVLAGFYFSVREPIPALETDTYADAWSEPAAAVQAVSAKKRLTELRREVGYPSVSAAVAVDGKFVWSEAQGYSELAHALRATRETPYAVGSVSKPLTAAVVMRLAERGAIDLDKDVRTYIPWFPAKAQPFTTRQLLSHQAGIRHYNFTLEPPIFSEFGSNVQYNNVKDSVGVFANDPLLFEPDSSFSYSSYGYVLLSAIVEVASGAPFIDTMQAELFTPLGMAHSGNDDKLHPVAGRADDYQNIMRDGHVIQAPDTNSSGKIAGGGFYSTPQDLVLFGVALLDDKVINAQTREMMFTPRKLKNGKVNPQDYALGFRVDMISDPAYPGKTWRAVHHGGVAVGSQAMLVLLPDQRVVVAITVNASTQPPARGMFDAATDIALLFAEARGK